MNTQSATIVSSLDSCRGGSWSRRPVNPAAMSIGWPLSVASRISSAVMSMCVVAPGSVHLNRTVDAERNVRLSVGARVRSSWTS